MNDFGSERYAIRVYPDLCTDGSYCWVAEHPDLPGCSVDAETIEEAKRLLDAARVAYLDVIGSESVEELAGLARGVVLRRK